MTKKRSNLKQLFLFNGLLFVVAIIIIQFSVKKNEVTQDNPVLTSDELSQALMINPYTPKLEGEFSKNVEVFKDSIAPNNINFKNILGKEMSLDDLKGQWVILNFWASWCPPCIVEMPSLQALHDNYSGKNLQVVAISLDRDIDEVRLRSIMQKYSFGPVAAYYGDWPAIKAHFKIDALPSTYILSPNGQAVMRISGAVDWASLDANTLIDSLLN